MHGEGEDCRNDATKMHREGEDCRKDATKMHGEVKKSAYKLAYVIFLL